MNWQKPSPRVVWKAIVAYLQQAYDGPPGEPMGFPADTPSAVRSRLETLRSTPDDAFYDSPVFERPPPNAKESRDPRAAPARYALRLGNRNYPHMKLVIDRAPDGNLYLLRADTHDAHVQPRPGSRDFVAFQQLAMANRELADRIESAWEAQGLPTFKKFLRDDLDRRKAAAANPAAGLVDGGPH